MAKAWIGLGSNRDEPARQLCSALRHLGATDGIDVLRTSGFYRTAPWGNTEQDSFVNAVAVLETALEPSTVLDVLLDIEFRMGRQRSDDRWGPRCIDLDLLTYNEVVLTTPELELPHPRMHQRAFVLRPLLELDQTFVIPGIGPAAAECAGLQNQEVQWLGTADEFCSETDRS